TADYRNSVYAPTNGVPGASLNQTAAISIFSGHVSSVGRTNVPNNGTTFLVRSAFGQPVQSMQKPDFNFGQEMKPDPALSVDLSQAPVLIDPAPKAFYVTNQSKVYA